MKLRTLRGAAAVAAGIWAAAGLRAAAAESAAAGTPAAAAVPIENVAPAVELSSPFPNHPLERGVMDRGVLLKDTPYFWDEPPGQRAMATPYLPLADGFTRKVMEAGVPRAEDRANHRLVFENNQIITPRRPFVNVQVTGFSAMYGNHDTFPITGVGMKELLPKGTAALGLGSLRWAIEAGGKTAWLDQFPEVTVSYRPGYAAWLCEDAALGVKLRIEVRPNISARGAIVRIETLTAPPEARLVSYFGGVGIYGHAASNTPNKVTFAEGAALITTPDMPRAQVYMQMIPAAAESALAPLTALDVLQPAITPPPAEAAPASPVARISAALTAGETLHTLIVWGADGYDPAMAEVVKRRMKPQALTQPNLDRVWGVWFENFIGKQLEPKQKLAALSADAGAAWSAAEGYWLERGERYTLKTPDEKLNALAGWAGPTMEYFRQPPGYMLGYISWQGYGHITSGWQGLAPIGDGDKLATYMETFAATRLNGNDDGSSAPIDSALSNDKEIRWTFLNLETVVSEPINMAYLDHIWNWWQWSGDKERLAALWPAFQDAIEGEMKNRDPDGDGMYHGFYEFWDCDAEQRGPKGAAQTAWMINGLRAGAKMATVLGKTELATKYAAEAERSLAAFNAQLWYPEIGICGARTADDQRYERASIHEVFIPAQRGVLTEKQAAQALRRVRYLYSQQSDFDKPLMFKNDVWPILWSQHYMPPGDICLLYMAAAKNGLAEDFYPYVEMIAAAGLEAEHAGLSLAVGQDGVISTTENGNSDAHSPFVWSLSEGMFGLSADGEPGKLKIAPNIPEKWLAESPKGSKAAATIGAVSIEIEQRGDNSERDDSVRIKITDKQKRALRVQWPTRRGVKSLRVNGDKTPFTMIEAVNRALVEIVPPAGETAEIEITFEGERLKLAECPLDVISDEWWGLRVQGGRATSVDDPQGALSKTEFTSQGEMQSFQFMPQGDGFRTVFIKLEGKGLSYWYPLSFKAGPRWEIDEVFAAADPPRTQPIRQIAPSLQAKERRLTVRIRNRGAKMQGDFRLSVAGETSTFPGLLIPGKGTREISAIMTEKAWKTLLPGSIPFSVSATNLRMPAPYIQSNAGPNAYVELAETAAQTGAVHAWPESAASANPAPPARERLVTLNLDAVRNLTPTAMEKVPMPLDFGGRNTLLGWYNTRFKMDPLPEDYEPLPGLPFKLSAQPDTEAGEPMLVLARGGSTTSTLPMEARIAIERPVERIYLLALFHYYAIKAYSPQAECVLEYTDGSQSIQALTPPFSVDSVLRPESPWTWPVHVGHSTDPGWAVEHYMLGPIHAQIIALPADPAKTLKSLRVRQTSTESYMGILGITLVKGG